MSQPQKILLPGPEFHIEDMAKAASNAWGNFDRNALDLASNASALKRPGEVLVACVSIKGDWNGAVLLICPKKLALETAAGIFGEQEEEKALVGATDMLGEIVNMIAGGVAHQIGTSGTLSLPVVAQGADISMGIQDGKIAAEVTMVCRTMPVHLMILEKDPSNLQSREE